MLEPLLHKNSDLRAPKPDALVVPRVTGFEEGGPYHEIKYQVPLSRLEMVMARANHYWMAVPRHFLGVTTTLYFDSPDGNMFRASRDGDTVKTKLRFRINATQGASSRYCIELKRRAGSIVDKKRLLTTGWDPNWIQDPVGFLANLDAKWAFEFMSGSTFRLGTLAPRILLQYTRRRFVCPHSGLRVNVDTDIKTLEIYPTLGARVVSSRKLDFAVLELKSANSPALPPELSRLHLYRESVSKFARLLMLHTDLTIPGA